MELEELKSKFEEKLGSTKLQLSEQTLSEVLQDALAEIGDDDTRLTDDFLTRKVNLAKKIDGQINFDVSQRIKDWEKQNTKPTPPIPKKKAKEDLLSDLTINRKTYAMVNSLIKQISDEVEQLIDNKNWFCIEDILEQPMSASTTAFFVTLRTLEYSRREVVDWYQVTAILDDIKKRFANHDCFVADPCAQSKKVDYSSDTSNLYRKKTLSVLLR